MSEPRVSDRPALARVIPAANRAAPPAPNRQVDLPGGVLVERSAEEQVLRDALASLDSGRSSVLTVTGRPGTGRTTLLRRTLALAKMSGIRTLQLRCSHAEAEVPYGLVAQLTSALTPSRRPTPSEQPGGAPARCDEFLAMARKQPLLIAVDDAQWADPASRLWIRSLVRRLHSAPVVLVCAVRGDAPELDDEQCDGPWPADGGQVVSARVLNLGPLSVAGVRGVIAAGCPGPVDEEFVAHALTVTGGLLSVLNTTMDRFARTAPRAAADQLPALSLRAAEATAQYLEDLTEDLPADALALLRAMAVGGDGLDFDFVRMLAPPQSTPTGKSLRLLVSYGLATLSGGPRPATAQIAETVLASMPVTVRHDLSTRAAHLGHHVAIADVELGRLLLDTPPIGLPWVVETLCRAVARHRADGRYATTSALLYRALREPLTVARRRGLLVELAAAELRDSPDGSDRRLQQVLLAPDGDSDGALLVHAADLLFSRGDAPSTSRVITAVCARPKLDPAALAPLIALGKLAEDDSVGEAAFPADSLPALPDLPTDPVQAAVVAWQLACRGRGRTRARALARLGLSRDGDRDRPLIPRVAACAALMYADDTAEALAGLDRVLADGRRRDARAAAAQALIARAALVRRSGRLNEAAEDLVAARAQLPLSCWSPRSLTGLLALEIALNLDRGQLDLAARAAAVELLPDAEHGLGWAHLLCARGAVDLATGKPEAALRAFQESGRVLSTRQWMNPAIAGWRVLAATAHRRCGNVTAALRLVTEELQLAKEWGSPSVLGSAHLNAWRALDGTRVTNDLEEAVRLLRDSPARLRFAAAATDMAAIRIDAGELDAAAALLREAEGVPSLYWADKLRVRVAHLAELLASRQAAPAVVPPGSSEGMLTQPEEHLAALAASGWSNADIADSLSVTTRTVELRLTKIYRKLEVTGRAGLRAVLERKPVER
ncbi:helix-turn-helix transcriptional regulator [Amycolatopsis sp. H20-H5]|uniref:helix-turn-helix transcriptional regulator n=1 Tax=Amycolatopsis sp. H20-H5 TaxID=3046309 RepID=UPI002DB64179|nr:AAA family ATPase [Amycolatopsis sp. H20-H5]MEC3981279.1 AAA family ATPase [Amycolatopsis sp. H20-H5]